MNRRPQVRRSALLAELKQSVAKGKASLSRQEPLEEAERKHILSVLEQTQLGPGRSSRGGAPAGDEATRTPTSYE